MITKILFSAIERTPKFSWRGLFEQVPPVEDPTVVCANKTTKGLCGTSVPQKSWVIIGPMLRAKPIPRV
ncbi:hypothetical protein KY290_025757 [Solanum tuberosum]|uniref:Uncharacterized protein n=1 Tax=Solanum tuberosum TaxID=4113 RepID=A0ABQ7UUH9_SOLTU|nr:hypothetical protein KY289_024812 [Solanum tuberosum]KAH0676798.1 hypothetical protein KY285_024599 [Solanum tuberosum]KAH0755487.1 hypothetical protein KY290_025757 [Solanum tuberosum]